MKIVDVKTPEELVSYLKHNKNLYCNTECSKKHKNELLLDKLKDSDNYFPCEICGKPVTNINSHLINFNKPGKKIDEIHLGWDFNRYKEEFPNSPTISNNLKKLYTERFLGENNLNHKNNTTQKQRDEKSPYHISFWQKKYPDKSLEEITSLWEEFHKETSAKVIPTTCLQYYLDKGHDETTAKKLLKERQSTFSLEKCKIKYGEDAGPKKWASRQLKWSTSFKKSNYSKVSQILFKEIFKALSNNEQLKCRFAQYDFKNNLFVETGRNFEERLILNNRLILPDFLLDKKIIEFDGTYWHNKNKIQAGNTDKDKIKGQLLKDNNYEILRVAENDFKKDKQLIIQKCINFLKK